MALNLDTAIRVVAKVAGLNEFQALTDSLGKVQSTAKSSAAGLQRMGVESRQLELSLGQTSARVGQALGQMANGATGAASKIKEFQLGLQPTGNQISRLRDQVLQFGEANTRTERSIRQQIDALKNLRSQAEISGPLYQQLTVDIERKLQKLSCTQEKVSKRGFAREIGRAHV